MEREVVEAWNFETAEELRDYLNQALMLAKAEGHSADTVYPANKRRMTLVRERLTDGSHVMNLFFFDGGQAEGTQNAASEMLAALNAASDALAGTLKARGYVPGSDISGWAQEVQTELRTLVTVRAAIAKATGAAS